MPWRQKGHRMTINHERLSAQFEGEALTPEETLRFVKLLFQMCPERRHQAYRMLELMIDEGARRG